MGNCSAYNFHRHSEDLKDFPSDLIDELTRESKIEPKSLYELICKSVKTLEISNLHVRLKL